MERLVGGEGVAVGGVGIVLWELGVLAERSLHLVSPSIVGTKAWSRSMDGLSSS